MSHSGKPGTTEERTFIAVKPDGVQRGLVGEIIKRFENKGYTMVGLKLLQPTKEQAEQHYIDLAGKPFYSGLTDYFSSGPIVGMVWQGSNVIKGGRNLLGATNPLDSAPGTIRGDFAVQVGRNIAHGSDGPEGAQREIAFWFNQDEIVEWKPAVTDWVYE